MLTTSIVNVCDEREWCTDYGTPKLSTCLFQFSHKTRQTLLLYAYFTTKVDFRRKFNHQQYCFFTNDDWHRGRTINTNRISNRTYDSKSNRIMKLRRSLLSTSVCPLSSVCLECIVAKRCVLEQKLLLTAYRKSYTYEKSIGNKMNDVDLRLEVVSRSCQPLRYVIRR